MTRGEGSASSGSATVWTRIAGVTADESQSAFEHGRVADHQRPGQVVQPRLEPAPGDHLGTDARDVAHRQADQRAIRPLVHAFSQSPGSASWKREKTGDRARRQANRLYLARRKPASEEIVVDCAGAVELGQAE